MYFIIDLVLILILGCVIFASIKFGFSRNFVFGVLRTIIGMAGAVGACVGVFLLMDTFGWLDFMADSLTNLFGNPAWLSVGTDTRVVARIITYLPFAVLFLILGYMLVYRLINLLVKGVFAPFFVARKKIKLVKAVDITLGLLFNLGLYLGFVFAVFGFIHGVNSVQDASGDYLYDDMSVLFLGDTEKADALTVFAADTIDSITGPMFNKWHESLMASPTGYVLYEYNPLNGIFEDIVKGMYGV